MRNIFEKIEEIYQTKKMNLTLLIVNFIWFAINVLNFVLAIVDKNIALTSIFGVLIGMNIFLIIAFLINNSRLKKQYSEEADRVMEKIDFETNKMMEVALKELEKVIDEEQKKEKKATTKKKVEPKKEEKKEPKKKN